MLLVRWAHSRVWSSRHLLLLAFPQGRGAKPEALIKAVVEGLGVAVLPKLLIQQDVASGNVVPLTLKEPLRRTLNIVYHKRKYLSESMQRFIALCRETGEQ